MNTPAEVSKEHCALWNKLYNLAFNECFGGDSSDAKATQLIADSEAKAVLNAAKSNWSESIGFIITERDQLRADCANLTIASSHSSDRNVELRAEVRAILKIVNEQTARAESAEREVERLKRDYDYDHKCLHEVRERCELWKQRAERAEASLHALRLVCGTTDAEKFSTWVDRANAKAEKAEAELAKAKAVLASIEEDGTEEHNAAVRLRQELATERARLDWLMAGGVCMVQHSGGFYVSRLHAQVSRAAIDSNMKEETK